MIKLRRCMLLLFVSLLTTSCRDSIGPEDYFHLSGSIRAFSTNAPIAGATIRVRFPTGLFGGPPTNGQILAETTSGTDGSYTVLVPPGPGYSSANCNTMWVFASASGFQDGSSEIKCPGGPGIANVTLVPR